MEPERTAEPPPQAALTSPARTWWGTSRPVANVAHSAADVVKFTFTTLRAHVRLDVPIVVFSLVFLALYAPLVPRNTDNPQLLAAYVNDEPFLTMALEATLVRPYGNPGNYFDSRRPSSGDLPDHWADMRYTNISYYGGAMFQLAFPPYAVLRAAGLPAFPTGPIVLRTITLLAGLLSLIVLYNFAKERGSRLAGLLAAAFVASDGYFIYYANYVHPDTLQLLFGLCAFLLAVAHARDGGRVSLVALGVFCGIVQGTKSGGPWTIPMALFALWLGTRASGRVNARSVRQFFAQTLVLGAAALVGLFISTPYAFLDSYYLRSMAMTFGVVSDNYLQLTETIALFTWAEALYHYIGLAGACLVGITIARAVYVNVRRISDPALALAVVLALSQFLWYGTASRVWQVLGYLVLGFGLMAALGFETLFIAVGKLVASASRRSRRAASELKAAWVVTALVVVVVVASGRWYVPASWAVDQYTVSHSTVRAANDWAIDHGVRSDAVIVFDDLAYFDRGRFPRAKMQGGVLTWGAVDTIDPDYIVLSKSLWGAEWMQRLIARQRLARRNPEPFNVSLYQDLLATKAPGPTKIPGIELEGILRPAPVSRQSSRLGDLANSCAGVVLCDLGVVDVQSELVLAADVERRVRALRSAGSAPVIGPELWIYHVLR